MNIVGYVFLGFIAVGVVIGLTLLITALPDIARYLKMKKM